MQRVNLTLTFPNRSAAAPRTTEVSATGVFVCIGHPTSEPTLVGRGFTVRSAMLDSVQSALFQQYTRRGAPLFTVEQLRFAIMLLAACLQAGVSLAQGLPQPLSQPQPQPGVMQLQLGSPQVPPGFPQPPTSQLPSGPEPPNAPHATPFGHLPAVTIREFRSSVPEVAARGATDMFVTALIKTRRFQVLERARMNEGIAQEKALNQQRVTTTDTAQSKYVGAGFIFEATVSEASTASETHAVGISIGGLTASRTNTKDTLAIDVRVIDIESSVVLDAIDVHKDVLGVETNAGGLTQAIASVLTHGNGNRVTTALSPNDQITSARKESMDSALRAAIEEAVRELANRFGADK